MAHSLTRLHEHMASGAASRSSRLRELQAFDDTKAGVKGLVDADVTAVPVIFHHRPDHIPVVVVASSDVDDVVIPVIDLADVERDRVVAQVRAAAETVGFFQLVNHGVSGEIMDETLAAVRRFNEEPTEAKRPYYTRDHARKVRFNSNFDLFKSPAANWRDTVFMEMAPEGPAPEEIPVACRGVIPEYVAAVQGLGEQLFELLSEALGLPVGHLGRDTGCVDGLSVAAHYYPACPEPHLTLGATRHSDPTFLTVLLQDTAMGGLQVLLERGWVDIPPVAGALVVNIGDLLQLISNDRLKSVEHRVVASGVGSRVSVACFFRPQYASTRVYGPIVIPSGSDDNGDARPAATVYRSTTAAEFLEYYNNKGLDGRSALEHFKLNPRVSAPSTAADLASIP
ncbi:hypothetical protein GUJ93_ZPchr0008g13230 [Zizania palustris]|uniref:Fe2OG dioxygenase domain-containing protein n=1 Tax=Zizania palustris TaxID=103762 RepID=A0A8J5UWX8_ZIZPA|nr:hypothetical protein GUJ93_ZPchr0008g13230 [Zizania palustris]